MRRSVIYEVKQDQQDMAMTGNVQDSALPILEDASRYLDMCAVIVNCDSCVTWGVILRMR